MRKSKQEYQFDIGASRVMADMAAIGIDLASASRGKHRQFDMFYPAVYRRDDGAASFDAVYHYRRSVAPSDPTLARIAKELQAIQRRAFYGLAATCTSSDGRMTVAVSNAGGKGIDAALASAEVSRIMHELAQWASQKMRAEPN